MAAIRQKLDKAFMEGKLSKVELAKELMFLCLIDAMPV